MPYSRTNQGPLGGKNGQRLGKFIVGEPVGVRCVRMFITFQTPSGGNSHSMTHVGIFGLVCFQRLLAVSAAQVADCTVRGLLGESSELALIDPHGKTVVTTRTHKATTHRPHGPQLHP